MKANEHSAVAATIHDEISKMVATVKGDRAFVDELAIKIAEKLRQVYNINLGNRKCED